MSKTHLSRPGDPAAHRDLGRYYRAIGIGAVAAALPYRGEVKNSAYAPARPRTAKSIVADDRMR
jgi:hypothetical protein